MSTTTANMGITVPAVGDDDYPTSTSSAMTVIDAHDHTSTKGVQIPTGGLEDAAVTSAKLADLSVTAGKLAANSVTTAKIANGDVTREKLEAVGQQVSSSSGTFTTTSSTLTDVTNLSVTITTNGRPVIMGLIPDGNAVDPAEIKSTDASTGASQLDVAFLEGTTVIGLWRITGENADTGPVAKAPVSAFQMIYPVAAGTYTFKVQVRVAPIGTETAAVSYTKFFAYEL